MTDDIITTDSWPPRGTCPVCGSGEIRHIVLGMPLPGEMLTAPEWVEFAGCIVDSPIDRVCETCRHEWVDAS